MSARILVVDDDADAGRVLQVRLEHAGYEVATAESAEEALGRVAKIDPALVITDLRMPGMSGLDLLEKLRSALPRVDVIVVTAHEDMTSAVEAMKAGAFDYLVKPLQMERVSALVARCLREQELNREAPGAGEGEEAEPEAMEASQGIVGRDPRMIDIYKMIGVLARNRATVLVRGETGTGKEMIARAVHAHGRHADQPFIAVNCTALTDTLLESELFGHVKGAFTGAVGGRKGYFELAGRGTILLDEIGDTSGEFQTRLLRVLQERQFYPVGGETPRVTDARVIAATHQPMEELVKAGTFREDLYFRLRVVEIRVPPLRERVDDIPLVAEALLARIRRETGQDVRQIAPEAMELLQAHPWPGNVREMENALTRAAIVARGPTIGPDHLILGTGRDGPDEDARWGGRSLAAVVARHARGVLREAVGDVDAAAAILEITPDRLRDILEEAAPGAGLAGDDGQG
ncbi:MAG TPA: sigma-54 dependent transcriptional regulator [Longimicrobiales bacterium]|jgi:DNA-binding NtrC family response regulator